MKKSTSFLLLLLMLSCTQRVTTNKMRSTAINDHIEWNYEMINGWQIMTSNEISNIEKSGKKAYSESTGKDVNINHEILLSIKKNKLNSLLALKQAYSIHAIPNPELIHKQTFDAIVNTYQAQDLLFKYDITTDTINNIVFNLLHTKLFNSIDSQLIVNQYVWEHTFRDYSFVINVNYNDTLSGNQLINMVKTSTFNRK